MRMQISSKTVVQARHDFKILMYSCPQVRSCPSLYMNVHLNIGFFAILF